MNTVTIRIRIPATSINQTAACLEFASAISLKSHLGIQRTQRFLRRCEWGYFIR